MRFFSILICFVSATLPALERGEGLRFVTEPTVFVDDKGQTTGGDAKLTQDLMRRLNIPGDIEVYPWKRAYALLQNEPNIALFPTTRTLARENRCKVGRTYCDCNLGFLRKQRFKHSVE